MMVSLWLLLGAGVLLASLSFVGERMFLGLPVLKSPKIGNIEWPDKQD